MSVLIATDAKKQSSVDDVSCLSTIKACAFLSADAICCIPCCMCFGGCCGKYEPYSASAFDLKTKPGQDRFAATCLVQCIASMIMPFTLCGCFWACCGTCTPCCRGVFNMVKRNDSKVVPSTTVTKPPTEQDINRDIQDFTNNFVARN